MYEKIGELNDGMVTLIMYDMEDGIMAIEMNVGTYGAMRMRVEQKDVLEFALDIIGKCGNE